MIRQQKVKQIPANFKYSLKTFENKYSHSHENHQQRNQANN